MSRARPPCFVTNEVLPGTGNSSETFSLRVSKRYINCFDVRLWHVLVQSRLAYCLALIVLRSRKGRCGLFCLLSAFLQITTRTCFGSVCRDAVSSDTRVRVPCAVVTLKEVTSILDAALTEGYSNM